MFKFSKNYKHTLDQDMVALDKAEVLLEDKLVADVKVEDNLLGKPHFFHKSVKQKTYLKKKSGRVKIRLKLYLHKEALRI